MRQTLLPSTFFVLFDHCLSIHSFIPSELRTLSHADRKDKADLPHPQSGDNCQIYLSGHQNPNQGWPPFCSCCACHNRESALLLVCVVASITLKIFMEMFNVRKFLGKMYLFKGFFWWQFSLVKKFNCSCQL